MPRREHLEHEQHACSVDEVVYFQSQLTLVSLIRVSLNWPLDAQANGTFFNRQAFHQDMFQKKPRCVNDDIWTFNSQCSSQWDGLRHFGYLREERFYNNVTMEQVHGTDANGNKSTVNGIQGESSSAFGAPTHP